MLVHSYIELQKQINNGKKITFQTEPSHLRQKAKFLNFMEMQIRKPENEGTLFRE